jgi:hypothetical protein
MMWKEALHFLSFTKIKTDYKPHPYYDLPLLDIQSEGTVVFYTL